MFIATLKRCLYHFWVQQGIALKLLHNRSNIKHTTMDRELQSRSVGSTEKLMGLWFNSYYESKSKLVYLTEESEGV